MAVVVHFQTACLISFAKNRAVTFSAIFLFDSTAPSHKGVRSGSTLTGLQTCQG